MAGGRANGRRCARARSRLPGAAESRWAQVRPRIRAPERAGARAQAGRLVRRRHKIVYTRVQRCAKVRKTKTKPPTTTPQPIPGTSGYPVTTLADTTSTSTTTTTPSPAPPSKARPRSMLIPGKAAWNWARPIRWRVGLPLPRTRRSACLPKPRYPTRATSRRSTRAIGGWGGVPIPMVGHVRHRVQCGRLSAFSTVLSVHDGVSDFYRHDDANGTPVGADRLRGRAETSTRPIGLTPGVRRWHPAGPAH